MSTVKDTEKADPRAFYGIRLVKGDDNSIVWYGQGARARERARVDKLIHGGQLVIGYMTRAKKAK